jgi:PII-like signaling protein
MIATVTRRRIDVLVDEPLCAWLVEQAAKSGIAHHSVLRVHSGHGRMGPWRDDGFGAVAKRMFVAITGEAKADDLLERLAPHIEQYGLVITMNDVQVMRGERF